VAVDSAVVAEEVGQNLQFAVQPKRERMETDSRNVGRGGFQQRDMGPPATVLEMGKFIHACEGEMVIESTNPKVPHFNAPIYLENKV